MRILISVFLTIALCSISNAGTIEIRVDASSPQWDTGAPIASTEGLYVRIYGAEKGRPKTVVDAAPWAPSLKFVRPNASTGKVHCYEATLGVDTDGDKVPDFESVHSAEWCVTAQDPPKIPKPPNSITGQSPAP